MKQGNLTDERYVKSLLSRAGIAPARSSGQNFLICPEVVEATLSVLDHNIENITELGAGVGTLTGALAEAGYHVRAIERDKVLANILFEQLPKKLRERVEILNKDLREVEWPGTIVGNIPYNLSGLIIRRITQLTPEPEQVILLVQKEVGQRMTASPPNMNLLGLAVQLWGEVKIILEVPASCFWPEPKVDSSLVLLVPRTEPVEDREKILQVAKTCFQAKRKQLSGTLKRAYGLGIDLKRRPQELSVQEWQELAKRVYS